MIAMKAKPANAMQAYIESVQHEIKGLRRGRYRAPWWLRRLLVTELSDALAKYRASPSCTVGMYLKDRIITSPPEATPRWQFYLTRQKPGPSLRALLARHGLKAQTTTDGVSLVFLRDNEWLQLLEGEIT